MTHYKLSVTAVHHRRQMIVGEPMNENVRMQQLVNNSLDRAQPIDFLVELVDLTIDGTQQPVLIFYRSEFIGWVRYSTGKTIWRHGNMSTGKVSKGIHFNDSCDDDGVFFLQMVSESIRHADYKWPDWYSEEGEVAEFVEAIENRLHAKQLSKTSNEKPAAENALTAVLPPKRPAPAPVKTSTPKVQSMPEDAPVLPPFNPSLHSLQRHPAAPGFTEAQLEGVRLVDVHPAVIPAVIGALVMFMSFVGGNPDVFVLVRWAGTAMAVWMAVVAGQQHRTPWVVLFVAMAILFNPIIPIYSTREFWQPVDFVSVILFWVAGVRLRASKPAPQ